MTHRAAVLSNHPWVSNMLALEELWYQCFYARETQDEDDAREPLLQDRRSTISFLQDSWCLEFW